MNDNQHKAGFVNIIGVPNVGKSTLMNAITGENLSIVNAKVQTTRHRIMGFVNGDDYQIVFSDTPGIIDKPSYKLHEAMMGFVGTALEDADVILFVMDVKEEIPSEEIIKKITKSGAPLIIAINKIDLSNQEFLENKVLQIKSAFESADIIPISAQHKFNIESLLKLIIAKLPESPPFFPKDELTDKTMRFFVSELIREQILIQYQKEIPYSCEVSIEEYLEESKRIEIRGTIYVNRETQKAIILGKGGLAIKRLGTEARKKIEEFTEKHIYLDLTVKVSKDWRENENQLKKFGYSNQ